MNSQTNVEILTNEIKKEDIEANPNFLRFYLLEYYSKLINRM